MNVLGVDYGSKNIGLAKANTGVSVVLPFGIIDNHDSVLAIKKLNQVVVEEKIEKIIAGLPFNFDGTENKNTVKIRDFFNQVQAVCRIPVEFVTEVFSSQAGDRMGPGVSRDEKAAMIILQSYFDTQSKE